MKYTVSFRNLYGNVEIANIEANGFDILDGCVCFYRSAKWIDEDEVENSEPIFAFKDWIHVSEAKEEVKDAKLA